MSQIENINDAIVDADERIEADGQLVLDGMPEPIETSLTLEQLVDMLIESTGTSEFTMYGVWKILSAVLETIGAVKDGKPYSVRSQMVYTYNSNKMVVKGQKVEVATVAQVRAFVIKFASKFVK